LGLKNRRERLIRNIQLSKVNTQRLINKNGNETPIILIGNSVGAVLLLLFTFILMKKIRLFPLIFGSLPKNVLMISIMFFHPGLTSLWGDVQIPL
jgi:hypothetical protein